MRDRERGRPEHAVAEQLFRASGNHLGANSRMGARPEGHVDIAKRRSREQGQDGVRWRSATYEQLRALRGKYAELWAKHQSLLRRAAVSARDRSGVLALALFALRSSEEAYAIADSEGVLFRNGRWMELERDRTQWRATAREPTAPVSAPTLVHLATAAAERLIGRAAPRHAVARYQRLERDDVFDVRFERVPGRRVIGVAIRDVTRLVRAERAAALAKRAVEESASPAERNVVIGE